MFKYLVKYCLTLLLLTLPAIGNSLAAQKMISEKVVLATDRHLYLSGEKILFSAKVFFDNGNGDATLSKIIYLELFKNGKALVQAKFKLENGFASGNIQLPNEMLSGNYYLRAYTRLMLNGEAENFYNTLIKVVNPERKLHESSALHQKIIEIIPEGGSFVAGMENRTCIIFNNKLQHTIEKAIVVNNKNDTLATVKIFENGLGEFTILPKLNEEAWMKIALKSGDSTFIKLGRAKNSGLVLNFNAEKKSANFFSQGEYAGLNLNFCLFNQHFEEIFHKKIILNHSHTKINLSDIAIEEGVNYIVLKDIGDNVISVAPFYVSPLKTNIINISLNQFYGKREKAEIEISDIYDGELIFYSVVKKGLFCQEEKNLLMEFVFNPLLLNSNYEKINDFSDLIKQQIELSFIFNQKTFNSIEFKKKFLNTNNNRKRLPEIRDLSISGTIKNRTNGEPLSGKLIFASVLGNQPQLHSYQSDENGNFIFSLNQLEGIKDVALTVGSADSLDIEIVVLSDFSMRFPAFRDFPLQLNSSQKHTLEEMYRNQQVGYKFEELVLSKEQNIDTLPFPFQDVQTSIVLNNFIELPTMQEVFNEIVTYVNVRKRGGRFYLNVLNATSETIYNQPLILIDNLPVFNIDEVMKIKPSLVEKIDVITKPYSLGEMNFDGIIMITTKTNDFASIKLPAETIFLKYQTSTLSSKQLFPNFSIDNIALNQPYFSNTVFWESNNTSHKSGIKKTFYTSDESGMFEVLLKVINAKGITGQGKTLFMVE